MFDSPYSVLIFFAIIILSIGAIFLLNKIYCDRKRQRILDELNAKEDSGVNTWLIDTPKGQVKLYTYYGSRYKTAEVSLIVNGDFNASCRIVKQTPINRFFIWLGLNKQFNQKKRELIDQFNFECEDEEFLDDLVGHYEFEQCVSEILKIFPSIIIKNNECKLQRRAADITVYDSSRIKVASEKILEFVKLIPPNNSSDGSETPQTDEYTAILSGLTPWSGIFLVFIALIIRMDLWHHCYPVLNTKDVFIFSLYFSIPLFLIYIFYIYAQIQKHSTTAQHLLGHFLIDGVAMVLLGWVLIQIFNGSLCRSASEEAHAVTLIKKEHFFHSKGPDEYCFTFNSWIKGRPTITVDVDLGFYNAISKGATCHVMTKKGALGFNWISNTTCEVVENIKPLYRIPAPSSSKPEDVEIYKAPAHKLEDDLMPLPKQFNAIGDESQNRD